MNTEVIGDPFSSMQIAEGDHFQQELTALGIMPSDPFQLEDNFGDNAPQLVSMNVNEDIAGEGIISAMPDIQIQMNAEIQSQMNAEIVAPTSVDLASLNENRPGFGYKCSLCGKRFLTSTWLDKHMAMHVKSEQFSCDKCGAVFSRKNGLYYHQLKEHSDKGPKTVNCKICGKTVGVGGPLTNHLRSHTLSAAHSAAQQYKKKLLKSQITYRKPQEVLKRNVRSLLKCNFCGKTFQRVSSLSNHLRVHTNVKVPNKKHVQKNKSVAKEPEVRNVTPEVRNDVTESLVKFQCHICSKFLMNNIALSNHLRIHGLTLAMKYYKRKQMAPGHLMKYKPKIQKNKPESVTKIQKPKYPPTVKSATYNPARIYKCKYCGLQFNNKFGMAGHVKAHKAEFALQSMSGADTADFSKPSTSADGCTNQTYETDTSNNQYVTSNVAVNEFPSLRDADIGENLNENLVNDVNVTECFNPVGDTQVNDFTSENAVTGANVDEFTSLSLLAVKCQICGVEFDSGVSLALHSRKHKRESGNSRETYKCLECFTILASRSGLMRHMLMHTGTRMHNCPECGIRFLQKIHLQRHLPAHQNRFPFKCDICTATYIEERGLVKHKRMHDDPNWGFTTCAHCKFVFGSTAVLKTHIRARHTGKQAFECNVCRAQFMKNTHLNQHMRLHDIQLKHTDGKNTTSFAAPSSQIQKPKRKRGKSNKKLICGVCHHAFGYVCSLKVHMRNIHRQFYCGICLKFVDNTYLSTASGMLHKSVCTSCYPGKGKKPKNSATLNKPQRSFQSEQSPVSGLLGELMSELVDEELFRSEGVLGKPANEQLRAMIKVCGATAPADTNSSIEDGMLENLKHLFSLCVGEDATSELLKCNSVEDILSGMLESLNESRC